MSSQDQINGGHTFAAGGVNIGDLMKVPIQLCS